MIFSEHGRSKRRSLRRSRMRRWARSGFAILSGLVVISLAVLSLVMANLSGGYDASPGYAAIPDLPQLQSKVSNRNKQQRLLDQTLAQLNTRKSSTVEEEYDTCDSEIEYPGTADKTTPDPMVADGASDQAAPKTNPDVAEPGEEILAQEPADQPQLDNGPSGPFSGPLAPAHPGLQPNGAAPSGQPFPQVAGSPRKPEHDSPSDTPWTPSSFPGAGGGGAPGATPAPRIASSGPGNDSTGFGDDTPGYVPADHTPAANPTDLPEELDSPQIADASNPTDGWFSPGHSPGIATVAGDFNLNGQTILFEILGTEAGTEYDQLQVEGIANLNEGNVVFAFINGYVPESSDLYDLILGQEILVDLEKVNFYYGLFDPANDPSYNLHAPHNLGLYTALDYKDGDPADDVKLYEENSGTATNNNGILTFDRLMRIAYMDQEGEKIQGPDQEFTPVDFTEPTDDNPRVSLATVPEPGPLMLLMASSLLLLRRFGKRNKG